MTQGIKEVGEKFLHLFTLGSRGVFALVEFEVMDVHESMDGLANKIEATGYRKEYPAIGWATIFEQIRPLPPTELLAYFPAAERAAYSAALQDKNSFSIMQVNCMK